MSFLVDALKTIAFVVVIVFVICVCWLVVKCSLFYLWLFFAGGKRNHNKIHRTT